MIPLVLGAGAVARVVYVKAFGDLDTRYRVRRGADGGNTRGGVLGEWVVSVFTVRRSSSGRRRRSARSATGSRAPVQEV